MRLAGYNDNNDNNLPMAFILVPVASEGMRNMAAVLVLEEVRARAQVTTKNWPA